MSNDNPTFFIRFRHMREKKNVTDAELAEVLGVDTDTIWKWSRGDSVPDEFQMKKLALFFGARLSLIDGTELKKAQRKPSPKGSPTVLTIVATKTNWLLRLITGGKR